MAAEQRAAEVAQHKVDLLQADGTVSCLSTV